MKNITFRNTDRVGTQRVYTFTVREYEREYDAYARCLDRMFIRNVDNIRSYVTRDNAHECYESNVIDRVARSTDDALIDDTSSQHVMLHINVVDESTTRCVDTFMQSIANTSNQYYNDEDDTTCDVEMTNVTDEQMMLIIEFVEQHTFASFINVDQ